MEFYFTDRQYNVLNVASTSKGSPFRIAGEAEVQSTEAATVALSGTLYFSHDLLAQARAMAKTMNYILYRDNQGVDQFLTILESHVNATNESISFAGDSAGNDLRNETLGSYAATKAMSFADYFAAFTFDSGWEIDINEAADLSRTLSWDGDETAYDRLMSLATQFGVKIDFSFDIHGTDPIKKYVNVYREMGADNNVTLRVGKELNSITIDTDAYEMYNAVSPTGATPEGSEKPITLAGYKWTDPEGRYILTSSGSLRDTVAVQEYSRLRSNKNTAPDDSWFNRSKPYEATTQATLLQSALADLKKYNHPAINYTLDVANLPNGLHKGDVVHLVDDELELYLTTTILDITTCYSAGTISMTAGDFKIEPNRLVAQIKDLASNLKTAKAGAKGADGRGIESTEFTYSASTSGTEAPADGWQAEPPATTDGEYTWTATTWHYTDGTSETSYSIAKNGSKGEQGEQGKQGIQGEKGETGKNGADGLNGRTSYIHEAWANSLDGTKDFTLTKPKPNLFDLSLFDAEATENSVGLSYTFTGEPNTVYTASSDYPVETSSYYDIWIDNLATAASSSVNGVAASHPRTFTTGDDGKFFVTVRPGDAVDVIKNGTYYIQIETGDVVTPHVDVTRFKYHGQCSNFSPNAPTTPASYTWTLDLSDSIAIDLADMKALAAETKAGADALTAKIKENSANLTAISKTANDAQAATVTNKAAIDANSTAITNAVQELTQSADGLSSQLNEVNQQLTADAITQTVLSSDDFLAAQNANSADLGAIQDSLDGLTSDAQATIQRVSQVEQTASGVKTTVDSLATEIDDQGQTITNVQNYMNFDDAGLTLGKSDSPLTINIDNKQMTFKDNGKQVAYVNGQKMYISDLQVLNSIKLGYHKISKYSDDGETTAVTYVGA